MEMPYGAWIRAPGRQATMGIGERWLRESPPNSCMGGSSTHHTEAIAKEKNPFTKGGMNVKMGPTNGKAIYAYGKQVIGGTFKAYNSTEGDTVMELCSQNSLVQEEIVGSDIKGRIMAEAKRRCKEGSSNGEDGEPDSQTHHVSEPTHTQPHISETASTGHQTHLDQRVSSVGTVGDWAIHV